MDTHQALKHETTPSFSDKRQKGKCTNEFFPMINATKKVCRWITWREILVINQLNAQILVL